MKLNPKIIKFLIILLNKPPVPIATMNNPIHGPYISGAPKGTIDVNVKIISPMK